MKLFKDYLQIKVERQEKTSGGLFLTDNKNIKEIAEVLAVGESVKEIKVGDKVIFKSWNVVKIL